MPSLFSVALFASAISGHSLLGRYPHFVQHERIDALPPGWTKAGEAVQDEPLQLRVALTQQHRDYLRIAEEVSDPASSRYGQHLSKEGLAAVLPDFSKQSASVISWLENHAIHDYDVGSDWVDFTTTVAEAKDMLRATFSAYSYLDNEPVLRTESYSLPADVREHIDFIHPTVHFFRPSKSRIPEMYKRQHIPTGPSNCSNSVCPSQLIKQYNIDYRPKDSASNSQIGILGFLDNFPNQTDVKSFLSQYGPVKNAAVPSIKVVSVNKGTTKMPADGGSLTVEAELDLDYSMSFIGPLPVTFFSVGGRGTQLSQPGNKTVSKSQNEPYLEFLQYILAEKNPPQVLSISYSDDEQSVPPTYARRVCDLFAQAAARGISVIGASGDGGAGGTGIGSNCKGPDGKHRFIPTFPSSCPWYTSVGATAGFGGAASFSSGGMSNYFARPSWQANQVASYIKDLNGTHKGYYNASGRGIPDVSLLGDDYLILTGGFPNQADGTSASTPVFASMIVLINDLRLRAKKPALGFLNPLLYAAKAQSAFRDVADGSTSNGCADGNTFEEGWAALRSWDAATGLGEPDFAKLKDVLC
nr:tripeptidyl-peptidase sed2 [Quercus suber]